MENSKKVAKKVSRRPQTPAAGEEKKARPMPAKSVTIRGAASTPGSLRKVPKRGTPAVHVRINEGQNRPAGERKDRRRRHESVPDARQGEESRPKRSRPDVPPISGEEVQIPERCAEEAKVPML